MFRIFDALNDVEQMRPAIDAVLATGTAVAEAGVCYTGDLLDPAEDLYTLDYYLRLAERMVAAGAHVLAVKDMAGLLRPRAAAKLVEAFRREFELPVHVHTHDTAGGQLATLLAASDAGADAVDVAAAPMAGTTSQPSFSALVAALAHTERDTGIPLAAVSDLEPYWEAVRHLYKPFESGLPGPTGRVYHHEIPGGQLSNLRQQAIALGLADRFELIEDLYAASNRILGRIPKVTPSSKVVGDLALQLAATEADPHDFEQHPERYDIPDSVVGLHGGRARRPAGRMAGAVPHQGARRPHREDRHHPDRRRRPRRARRRRRHPAGGPEPPALPRADEAVRRAARAASATSRSSTPPTTSTGCSPAASTRCGSRSGVQLFVALEAIGEADGKGMRTVMTTLNGQLRPVFVRDRSITVSTRSAEKADPNRAGEIGAPFAGVVTVKVEQGAAVEPGQTIATIEAMKMEASITTPVGGKVARLVVSGTAQVEAQDLLVVVE